MVRSGLLYRESQQPTPLSIAVALVDAADTSFHHRGLPHRPHKSAFAAEETITRYSHSGPSADFDAEVFDPQVFALEDTSCLRPCLLTHPFLLPAAYCWIPGSFEDSPGGLYHCAGAIHQPGTLQTTTSMRVPQTCLCSHTAASEHGLLQECR